MRNRRIMLLVLIASVFFHIYSMESGDTAHLQSKKNVLIPWCIRNFLRDTLYVCLQEESASIPLPASITRSSDPANEMAQEGTITLESCDCAAYEIKKVKFPLRARIWTAKNKKGIDFKVDSIEALTTHQQRYPLWRIEPAELSDK